MKLASLLVLFALAGGPLAAELTRHTDLAEARKLARKEKKNLLIEFTGLDWCTGCQDLRSRVFALEAFEEWMGSEYIWVEIDFPKDRGVLADVSPELKKQNDALRARYGVVGYPTVFLCDDAGRPYARRRGFDPHGTADEYLVELAKLHENRDRRNLAFRRAKKLKGAEKYAALAEGLAVVPLASVREFYPRQFELLQDKAPDAAVVKAVKDLEDKTSLVDQLRQLRKESAHEETVALVDRLRKEGAHQGADLQEILMFKAEAQFALEDRTGAGATVTEVAEIQLKNVHGQRAARLMQKIVAADYREQIGTTKETGGPPTVKFQANPAARVKEYLPGESPALDGKDLSKLSLPALKASWALTREEITRVEKLVAREHAEWRRLDAEFRQAGDQPGAADTHRAAIARLKADHDKSHAALEALEKRFAAHEKELARWRKVRDAEAEAADLLKRVEALRKRAEEVERGEFPPGKE